MPPVVVLSLVLGSPVEVLSLVLGSPLVLSLVLSELLLVSSGPVVLEPGDLVIVCSDGVTEARNRAGDEFGRDRLVDVVRKSHGAKPEVVLEHLIGAVKQFSEGAAQADDVTALVLRYRGKA